MGQCVASMHSGRRGGATARLGGAPAPTCSPQTNAHLAEGGGGVEGAAQPGVPAEGAGDLKLRAGRGMEWGTHRVAGRLANQERLPPEAKARLSPAAGTAPHAHAAGKRRGPAHAPARAHRRLPTDPPWCPRGSGWRRRCACPWAAGRARPPGTWGRRPGSGNTSRCCLHKSVKRARKEGRRRGYVHGKQA